VFLNEDGSSGGVVCVAVRFRSDFGQSAPRVAVFMQMSGFIAVNILKPSQIRVTPAGFAFTLKQADLGAAHNMVVNWIATSERPKNQALQCLMESITSSQGTSLSSSKNDLEKNVGKFISTNGTEVCDSTGQTLLHVAASAGNMALVKFLLGKGAHIDAEDEHGWTALLCAISGGHMALARYLLDVGANCTISTESGSNCLHYMARYPSDSEDYKEILSTILKRGCDPNGYNFDGDTALSAFCQRCTNLEPITQLLTYGGIVSVANNNGYSPLHIAVMLGNLPLAKLLCKHGANPDFAPNDKVGSAHQLATKENKKELIEFFSLLKGSGSGDQLLSRSAEEASFVVQIIEAVGLPVVCDAYAVLRCGLRNEIRTNIVSQTQNPMWKHSCKLEKISEKTLTLEVWNYSMVQSCIIFGKAVVNLDFIGSEATEIWLPLTEKGESVSSDAAGANSRVNGRIHLILKRTSGHAVIPDDDPFVTRTIPKESWNTHPGGVFAPWCIGGEGLNKGYNLEIASTDVTHVNPVPVIFDHHASDFRYKKNFNESSAVVFAVVDHNPVVVSIDEVPQGQPHKAIIRTKKEDFFCYAPAGKNEISVVKSLNSSVPILQFREKVRWQSFKSKAIHEELLYFEKITRVGRYKFGLMYAGPNQSKENEIFDNCDVSKGFLDFCDFIGTRITLRGFKGYNGGLDTKNDDTGRESVMTTFGDGDDPLQIMFHVAPFLPFQPDDPQRVERKRHIGNDVCVLIYKESANEQDTVNVSTFVSHFNNIFIIVSPVAGLPPDAPPKFRVSVCCKSAIRPFPPYIPASGNVFEKSPLLRVWLLEKLINAERVAMEAPDFRGSMMRTRKEMLSTVIQHCTERKQ